MHQTIANLLSLGPVLTDGAWGTELQRRGLPLGACPDVWNLEQPEKVEQVAFAYVAAGSRIILTNTFGANRFALSRHGLEGRRKEINRAGVEISLRASAGQALVFASVGPSGLMPSAGQVSAAELEAGFSEQIQVLADAGAQGLVIETMSDPAEALAAVAAARRTGLPVVTCFTFDCGPKQDRTLTGATPEQVAAIMAEAGADVVGANCSHGIADMVEICRRLRTVTSLPLWIKANAGLPELSDGQVVYRQTPEEFSAFVPQLLEAGAMFIGGCCGTTPDFIRAVGRELARGFPSPAP